MLAGLEILSKVFDQQSSPMVSKILQQVRGRGRGDAAVAPLGQAEVPTVPMALGWQGGVLLILPIPGGLGWWALGAGGPVRGL